MALGRYSYMKWSREDELLASLPAQMKAAKSGFRRYAYDWPALVTMLGVFKRQYPGLPSDSIAEYLRQFPSSYDRSPCPSIDGLTVDELKELLRSQKEKGLPYDGTLQNLICAFIDHNGIGSVIRKAIKNGTVAEFLSTDILFCENGRGMSDMDSGQWFLLKPLGVMLTTSSNLTLTKAILDCYRALGEEEGYALLCKHYDEWLAKKSMVLEQLDTIERIRPAIALLDQLAQGKVVDDAALKFKEKVEHICAEEYRNRVLICGGFHEEGEITQFLKATRDDRSPRWNEEILMLFDVMTVKLILSSRSVIPFASYHDTLKTWEVLCQYMRVPQNRERIQTEINAKYEITCAWQREAIQLRDTIFPSAKTTTRSLPRKP
ncbi:MAG TPA: hypothetical protein VNC84_02435 [Gammaproteobacteria bacterium]|nr:hypothetical protein [Gammaproteobacteria bacterium]